MGTAQAEITFGDRYELRAYLATGGMATVFRGWDHRLERPVAIKVLCGLDSEDPLDVRRFRREARAAAMLHSPYIVKVYDFLEDQGDYYLVMELVDGINLKQRIAANGPLAPREVFAIAAQVCQGLGAAHAAGLIHRDIKPQNILLGADGTAKLADFGIVHIPLAPRLTASGLVLGTADYISPEQAQGLSLSPATDLYSLGVVLYEALTGALPFTGTTPVAVALRHATEPVVPPRRLNPHIPEDVERVVLRAMRKDPAERYPTAEAMAAALLQAMNASPPQVTADIWPVSAGDGSEWRSLVQTRFRSQHEDVAADEAFDEALQIEEAGFQSAARDQYARRKLPETPLFAQLAAIPPLAAAMLVAALLVAGIMLLHLIA